MSKQAKIILFSCLYALGVLSSFYNPILAIVIILLISLSIFQYRKNVFSTNYFISLFIIFIIGIFNANIHLKVDDDLTPFSDNNVNLIAKVISIPSNNIENKTKFYAKAEKIITENTEKENLNAKTLVTINDDSKKLKNIKIGDTLNIKGRLKIPSIATNPSQFDYAKYLQNKNTFSLLYANSEWEIIERANDFKGKLIRKLNDTRNDILNIHKQNIKSPMIEILGGIIFGDDAVNPDDDTKDSFIKSGIFHILAASGMNVTLIFGIWFFFAKSLRLNYKLSILSGIILILVYTCMTGFGPPIIRAFLMLTLILIGKLIDKDTSTIALLFIVGTLMLLYNPLMIFDIGFQLSFIVTFALIITAPLINFNFKYKAINYILGACMIPIIAQLYAAPLQMYYFNSFSIYSVFANIAIIPVLSLVSFIGFISSILALIPMLSNKICLLADTILNPFLIYIVKIADFFASLPMAVISVKKPLLIQLILYFAVIITLTITLKNKTFNKKIKIVIATLLLCLLITFIPQAKNHTEVIFFSVGNADAILIKSPQNKYHLIDTGKLPYKTGSSQANYIIIKYLKDKGIKTIDSLTLSHFDSDHAGGTIDILKNLNVKNIYISDSYEDTMLSTNITNFIKEKNLNTTIVNNEKVIENEKDFSIKATRNSNLNDENEKSIITLLEDKNHKVLFMGDGNINTFKQLPNNYKENLSVIKVGHHGAKGTLNSNILANLYIISTGTNVYGHPHPETIGFLKDKKFIRTDYQNAIKLELAKNLKIYSYSPKANKFIFLNE